MKKNRRRYKSKNQQVALAGFTFGMVFLGILAMIMLSANTPSYNNFDKASQQDILLSEAMVRLRN